MRTPEAWQKSQRKSCRHQNANLCENSTQELNLDFQFEPKFNPNKNGRQQSYGWLVNLTLSCANCRIRCSNGRSLGRGRTEQSIKNGPRRSEAGTNCLDRPAVTSLIPQMCNGSFTLSCLRTSMNGNAFVEGKPLFNL